MSPARAIQFVFALPCRNWLNIALWPFVHTTVIFGAAVIRQLSDVLGPYRVFWSGPLEQAQLLAVSLAPGRRLASTNPTGVPPHSDSRQARIVHVGCTEGKRPNADARKPQIGNSASFRGALAERKAAQALSAGGGEDAPAVSSRGRRRLGSSLGTTIWVKSVTHKQAAHRTEVHRASLAHYVFPPMPFGYSRVWVRSRYSTSRISVGVAVDGFPLS